MSDLLARDQVVEVVSQHLLDPVYWAYGASCRHFRCMVFAGTTKIEFGSGARPAEQITLGHVYPRRAQRFKLLVGLDSLRRDRDVENPADRQNGRYDGRAFRALRHIPDERLIDLDLVEREHGQI